MNEYAGIHETPAPPRGKTRIGLDVRREPDHTQGLARDVDLGLRATPKSLPPKHFYDARGSQLFEQICDTVEYYPTRTEQALLEQYADTIVRETKPVCIVELGSGSARKISTVLEAVDKDRARCTYVPFDVSRSMLEESAKALVERFEWLNVHAIVGDYDKDLDALPRLGPTLFMFLGGTIGNFTPGEATSFLRNVRKHMRPGDRFLLGTDLVKDSQVLNLAYNDRRGVTAAFNKNVLSVINHKLNADFDLSAFDHVAYFDETKQQIEMYLESRQHQIVPIRDLDIEIEFNAGERMLTEISRKFTQTSVRHMLGWAGLGLSSWFESQDGYFALSLSELRESDGRRTNSSQNSAL
jgi:L-histidine N-alpha-methyltransferase